jgi:hypothetical protein
MPFGVHQRDARPWEGLLRSLGVIFVFLGVIWLFWKHNARTLEMLESQRGAGEHVVLDKAGALTDEQRKAIRDLSRAMKSSYGLDLQVVVDVEPIDAPRSDVSLIFVGLYPEGRQSLVVLPPLVERAVGRGLANHLRDDHFSPYWGSGDWRRGLGEALGMIWNALNEPSGKNIPMTDGEYRGKVGEEIQ